MPLTWRWANLSSDRPRGDERDSQRVSLLARSLRSLGGGGGDAINFCNAIGIPVGAENFSGVDCVITRNVVELSVLFREKVG